LKIKFKHQKFQADAANAVCDVFAGQPNISSTYIIDRGADDIYAQLKMTEESEFTGFNNKKVIISDDIIKSNLQRIQRQNLIKLNRAFKQA